MTARAHLGRILAVICGCLFPLAAAGSPTVGARAFEFLTLGVGGRPLALGGAFAAIADDVSAMHYNPAGMAGLDHPEATLFYRTWAGQANYSYLGAAGPIGAFGVAGGNLMRMGGAPIDAYDDQGTLVGSVSPSSLLATASLGVNLATRLMVGGTVKYGEEDLGFGGAAVVAADLGVRWDARPGLRLGALVSNLGGSPEGGALPLSVRAGVSGSLQRIPLTGILEAVNRPDDDSRILTGLEYRLGGFALRGGYGLEVGGSGTGGASGLSAGIGLTLGALGLDYAFASLGDLGYSHLLALVYRGSPAGASGVGRPPLQEVPAAVVPPATALPETPAEPEPAPAASPATE